MGDNFYTKGNAGAPGPGKGNRGGKKGRRNVTKADLAAFTRILQETGNVAEVARRTGFSYVTVWKHLKDLPSHQKPEAGFVAESQIPAPKLWEDLNEKERGWLEDFVSFRREFFGRETPPFHVEIANQITAAEFQKIQVLTPPGFGKTQTFSIDFPIWQMIRARASNNPEGWACLLVSKTSAMARAFLSQIKRELEQNNKLQRAFGRFKPEFPDSWSQGQITVEGFPIRKEGTFIAAGMDSQVYGWRVLLIITDDIVDGQNSATPEASANLTKKFTEEIVSRLDPGGVIVNVGTRFSVFDHHGKLLRQRDDEGEPIWHPIVYRAHDDSRCTGEHCMECKERCPHDKPYPEGCCLWPAWVSYRKLRSLRAGQTTSQRFDFVYNQLEVPEEGALVKPEWVEAAKDNHRVLWTVPQNTQVMCTLDPSPTKWAVFECWAYDPVERMNYLVAIQRKMRMQAPAYLATMREWTQRLRRLGKEPLWIVEINAAQRWLLESTEYQQMRMELGLTVRAHTTGRNKADPEYGIGMLGPLYEYGKISLPWGDHESRMAVGPLCEELISYPGETDDCVMAHWFYTHNLNKMNRGIDGQWLPNESMPHYMLERRAYHDMRNGSIQLVTL